MRLRRTSNHMGITYRYSMHRWCRDWSTSGKLYHIHVHVKMYMITMCVHAETHAETERDKDRQRQKETKTERQRERELPALQTPVDFLQSTRLLLCRTLHERRYTYEWDIVIRQNIINDITLLLPKNNTNSKSFVRRVPCYLESEVHAAFLGLGEMRENGLKFSPTLPEQPHKAHILEV